MVLSWVPVAPHSKLSEKYYCIFFHNSITPDVLWKPKPSQSILALPLCQHFFWLADEWVLSFFQFYTPLASICARITRQNVSSEGSLIVALARPTLFEALLFSSIHSVHSKLFSVAKTFSPIICEGNFSCKNILFSHLWDLQTRQNRDQENSLLPIQRHHCPASHLRYASSCWSNKLCWKSTGSLGPFSHQMLVSDNCMFRMSETHSYRG